jgi:hypothetical protein
MERPSIPSGQHCPQSGIWVTTDDCRVEGIISRAESLPHCPHCGTATHWRLERPIPAQSRRDQGVERRLDDFLETRGPEARA